MAAFMTITGNLTRDPELKQLGGQQACTFMVAVRTRTKNKDDGTYKTNFYDCTYFGKLGEYFMARAQKGTAVTVIGELTADAYVSNGEPHPSLRINVSTAECQGRTKEACAAPASRTSAPTVDNDIPF